MKSSSQYLTLFFVFLVLVGGYTVFTFTGEKQHEVRLALQAYENLDSLVHTMHESMKVTSSHIFFLGVDPEMPECTELVQKWIADEALRGQPYQAVVVDEVLSSVVKLEKSDLIQDSFNFHRNPERLMSGIQTASEKNIKLLVVVQNADALKSRVDSLFAQTVSKFQSANSMIFVKFPKTREEEGSLSLPCNTGEEDRALVASLGCYILQKSRHWYAKKINSEKPMQWMAELDQLISGESLVLLAPFK